MTMSQKIGVLVNCPINEENREKLLNHFDLYFAEEVPDKNLLLKEIGNKIEIIISDGPRTIDASLMDQLPNLKLICLQSVGIDHLDIEVARERDIRVTNAAGTNAISCADQAFALMLALYRNIVVNNKAMHENKADEETPFTRTNTISGKKIGILGLGMIGIEIAKRAEAFDMGIYYHNRSIRNDVKYKYCSSLMELATKVKILVVACPGGNATRGIINSAVLEALGSDGTLINIARGSIVDTAALVEALQKNIIRNAGLDVVTGSTNDRLKLCNVENVVMSPHIAGNTQESWVNRNDLTRKILMEIITGKRLSNQLN